MGDRLERLARIEEPPFVFVSVRLEGKCDGEEVWSNGSVSLAVVAWASLPLFRPLVSLEDGCLISFPPLGGEGNDCGEF